MMKFLDALRNEFVNATSVKSALGRPDMVDTKDESYEAVDLLNVSVDKGKYSLVVSQIAPYEGRLVVRETLSGNVILTKKIDLYFEDRAAPTSMERDKWQREAAEAIDNFEWIMDYDPYSYG